MKSGSDRTSGGDSKKRKKTKGLNECENGQRDEVLENSMDSIAYERSNVCEEVIRQDYGDEESIVGNEKKKSRFALPSKAEQLALQQTEILIKSNLLQLQVDEMLTEVKNHVFDRLYLKSWTESFVQLLSSTPELSQPSSSLPHEESGRSEGKKNRSKCNDDKDGPSPPLTLSKKWLLSLSDSTLWGSIFDSIKLDGYNQESLTLLFQKPRSVSIIGSSALRTATAPIHNIDIVVQMPEECFDDRDILNHAYFDKRKLYMAGLVEYFLRGSELIDGCSIADFKGDTRKSTIIVKPKSKKLRDIAVRIFLTAPPCAFKLTQLNVVKNNVRPAWWMAALKENKKKDLDPSSLKPTPFYNMAVLEDLAIIPQFKILSKVLEACPQARDAIILLKIWLTQRELRFGVDTLDGHSASLLIAYLYQSRRISGQASSIIAFQITLNFLAEMDISSSVMDFSTIEISKILSVDKGNHPFCATLNHLIIDEAGSKILFNAFWRLSLSAIEDLRDEAKHTLLTMQREAENTVNIIFLNRRSFSDRYDLFFSVPTMIMPTHDPLILDRGEEARTQLCDMTSFQYFSKEIKNILQSALSDRVMCIRTQIVFEDEKKSLRDDDASILKPVNADSRVVVGIVLNKERVQLRVDRGPSAENVEEVSAFRSFWGPKSQLRRFHDGSILEAVIWGEDSMPSTSRAESIIEEIVRYILGYHLPRVSGVNGSLVRWDTFDVGSILSSYAISGSSDDLDPRLKVGADSRTRDAVENLDRLRAILTSDMKGLPLVLENVMGYSPELRYTSVVAPMKHPVIEDTKTSFKAFYGRTISFAIQPLLVTAKIESNGKWPTNVQAQIKTKTAIFLRISQLLKTQFEIRTVVHRTALDIFFGGYIFRFNLHRDQISKDVKDSDTLTSILTLHHHNIRSVQAEFPSYSHAVRMLATWASCHMLSGHLPHEAIELIVASVYLNPSTLHAPSSPYSAFLRSLKCICETDWECSPLLINFPGYSLGNAKTEFLKRRKEDPSFAPMYIASTNHDYIFTVRQPELVVLSSLIIPAARATLLRAKVILRDGLQSSLAPDKFLFATNILHRQFRILFKFAKNICLPKSSLNDLDKSCALGAPFARAEIFANMTRTSVSVENLVVESSTCPNPIQESIVEKIREKFGHLLLVFWNNLSGREIVVVPRPGSLLPNLTLSTLHMKHRLVIETPGTQSNAKRDINLSILNATGVFSEVLATSDGLLNNFSLINDDETT